MVMDQLRARGRGIFDPRVLAAMEQVPRHRFVPEDLQHAAYDDAALPIGFAQTISQPYIVALMTQTLELTSRDRVLEIGTGSGYQAAVLSRVVGSVVSLEIVPELARRARLLLESIGCANVELHEGDGHFGWPQGAPYDAIMVTCSPDAIPEPLIKQLREGGKMMIPVGPEQDQRLLLLRRTADGVEEKEMLHVRFVPMTGAGRASGE